MKATYNGIGSVYSDAVIAGDEIYLSGLVSEDWETGELCPGTIEEETDRVLSNMKKMLMRYGSDMDKLIRVEIFLTDFSERDRMNTVYIRHFDKERMPSRLCVGVNALAEGCKVEMTAHAYIDR